MSDTKISPADFAKLVKQANLVLSDGEKSKIHSQLDEALTSVKVLSELDTAGIPGTTSASGLTNVLREDEVKPSFPQDVALQNAKNKHNGYFMVPAIFDSQDN
jgi:aspartyl-tRNA(Asn)/glutamyl-tRNA(Gln) amidotransferase subunit C